MKKTTATAAIPTYRASKYRAVHAYTLSWATWQTIAHRYPSAGWWSRPAKDRVCVYLRHPSDRLLAVSLRYSRVRND